MIVILKNKSKNSYKMWKFENKTILEGITERTKIWFLNFNSKKKYTSNEKLSCARSGHFCVFLYICLVLPKLIPL